MKKLSWCTYEHVCAFAIIYTKSHHIGYAETAVQSISAPPPPPPLKKRRIWNFTIKIPTKSARILVTF